MHMEHHFSRNPQIKYTYDASNCLLNLLLLISIKDMQKQSYDIPHKT
jgi:hypothetical protein